MRDFRLLYESINLSCTIQLSGYPSVMGSLWTVIDSHSSEVSRYICGLILQECKFDSIRSVEGLRLAVRVLKYMTRLKVRSDMVGGVYSLDAILLQI